MHLARRNKPAPVGSTDTAGRAHKDYRATKRRYFCVGSEISISIRFAISFSGWWTLATRCSRSANDLNGPFLRSSRIAHIVFLPRPGNSSSMWKRVVIAYRSEEHTYEHQSPY